MVHDVADGSKHVLIYDNGVVVVSPYRKYYKTVCLGVWKRVH